jgi:hypothetical protein
MEKAGIGWLAQGVFNPVQRATENEEELIATLYQQIGQLKVQVDWLKKITNTALKPNERSLSRGILS